MLIALSKESQWLQQKAKEVNPYPNRLEKQRGATKDTEVCPLK